MDDCYVLCGFGFERRLVLLCCYCCYSLILFRFLFLLRGPSSFAVFAVGFCGLCVGGLGFGVLGLGFGDWGLGFWGWGLGCRVLCSAFRKYEDARS